MRVLVVGGLTRLDPHYRKAEDAEVDAVYVDSPHLEARCAAADALVLVLGNVSHNAAAKARHVARRDGKPLAQVTSPSVSRVHGAIATLARAS